MHTLIDRIRRSLSNFRRADGANVTVTFALSTIPLMGFVGAAVDYSHANSVKTALQAAADSTALMLSKTASTDTSAQIQSKASTYFTALFTRPEATGVTVTATYNKTNGNQIIVLASANVKANFTGLIGVSQMKVAADSQVKWGNTRMRVALALDNTGSMADDGKMDALIPAATSLLTQLKTAAVTNGDVLVSIVPFAKDVNMGASNKNANWLDWTDWDANNGSCSKGWNISNKTDCLNQNGSPKWTADNHNTWTGCVMDRGNSAAPHSSNYDANATTPNSSTAATLYPAEQYSDCPAAGVLPLTYDWVALAARVAIMTPNGGTNQTIGLQVAWQSLVGGGPFPTPPVKDPNYKYQDAIVLMSDGLNTMDRWYGNGYSVSSQVDDRMALACANAKAAGVIIYTVHVNTGGDPTSTILKNCASDSGKFYSITVANQLVSAFTQIGTQLSNLRISQ